jgi:hypothetical protein
VTTLPAIRGSNRQVFSRAGITATFWVIGIHLVGWTMGMVFSLHLGFWPVWFFDCTACVVTGPSLPTGWGPLGGMSLFAVLGAAGATRLWLGDRRGMSGAEHRIWSAVAAGSMLVLAWLAFAGRFPGTLPTVLIGVIPPLIAGSLFAAATRSSFRSAPVPRGEAGLPRLVRIARATAVVAVATLGGVLSVAAVVLGALAWERSIEGRGQRWAALAIGLGIASGVLRWALISRYEAFGPLF